MLSISSPLPKEKLLNVSSLALAHVGDGIFELLVRTRLTLDGSLTAAKLHKKTVELVRASAQAEFMKKIAPLLTPEELSVYQRGRNCHVTHVPKGATPGEYSSATGLEALFGWLYLSGMAERIDELFEAGVK
ncbi:MAG: ribonuclease III [Clostridiales bacterium]|nr:ribonuclease III [Clostridiales bacterium]